MCGIVAVSGRGLENVSLERSVEAISHRGPDASGVFASTKMDCYLGHTRLAIFDLSEMGNQPMMDASGRYVVAYNGEIYNFQELKRSLEECYGPIFWRSRSDTEVLLEGLARVGLSFLERLNGIFAIALYDQATQTLHVLRDPMGVKPLFVSTQNGNTYFCSELKGLLGFSDLNKTLNLAALAQQIAFMYIPEPNTIYREFVKLAPGVLYSYRYGEICGEKKLFEWLDDKIEFVDERDAFLALEGSFSSAVKLQLASDVPVSLMLSGGLDSSAIAYEAVNSGANIHSAYTIATSVSDLRRDQQSDDLKHAKIVAEQLGLRLEVIEAEKSFMELLPSLSSFMEDGISDPAAINSYLISKAASEAGIKVLLTGQAADEYLGGYRRYQAERYISAMPEFVRSIVSKSASAVANRSTSQSNAFMRRVQRFASLAGKSDMERALSLYTWADQSLISDLFLDKSIENIGHSFFSYLREHEGCDSVQILMDIDRHYDLMSLNLTYCDRMSMATGVEARVPFLDFNLVRVMRSLPMNLKIRNGTGKFLFKKVMESKLPKEIVYREKAGFGAPIRSWLSDDLDIVSHYLDSSRIKQQGIFNSSTIDQILLEQRSGMNDHANLLFALICAQVQLESIAGI